MKQKQKKNKRYWLNRVVASFLLSLGITFIIAIFLTLIPNRGHHTSSSRTNSIDFTEHNLSRSDKINYDTTSVEGIAENVRNKLKNLGNEEVEEESNLVYFMVSVYREFSFFLFLFFFCVVFLFIDSITWKDYFPVASELKESGIHAKLNYQIIADRLSRKLAILMSFILLFSIGFIFVIFKFSSELDSIIHTEDIVAYEQWINSIEQHIGKNNKDFTNTLEYFNLIETNTELFWRVYFIRYIVVRAFIAFIVGSLITFLIRLSLVSGYKSQIFS